MPMLKRTQTKRNVQHVFLVQKQSMRTQLVAESTKSSIKWEKGMFEKSMLLSLRGQGRGTFA